jgi:hypothetical protein
MVRATQVETLGTLDISIHIPTMGTENFWKQLLHNHLVHHMLRPRLDLLVWILITKVAYFPLADVSHTHPIS